MLGKKRYNNFFYNIDNLYWNNASIYYPEDIEDILQPLEVVATSDNLKLKALNLIEFEITSIYNFNYIKSVNIDDPEDILYYIARPVIWKDNTGEVITYNLELDCFNTYVNRNKEHLKAVLNKTSNPSYIKHSFDISLLNYLNYEHQEMGVIRRNPGVETTFFEPIRGEKIKTHITTRVTNFGKDTYNEIPDVLNSYHSFLRYFKGNESYWSLTNSQKMKMLDFKILDPKSAKGIYVTSTVRASNEKVNLSHRELEKVRNFEEVETYEYERTYFPVHDWDFLMSYNAFVCLLEENNKTNILYVRGQYANLFNINQYTTNTFNRYLTNQNDFLSYVNGASHICLFTSNSLYIFKVGETPLINLTNFSSGIYQSLENDSLNKKGFKLQQEAMQQTRNQQITNSVIGALTAPAQLALLAATGGIASPLLATFNIATNLLGSAVSGSFLSKQYQRQQEQNELDFLKSNLKVYNNNFVTLTSSKQISENGIVFLNLPDIKVNHLFEVIDDSIHEIRYEKGWFNFRNIIIPNVNKEYLKFLENRDIKII